MSPITGLTPTSQSVVRRTATWTIDQERVRRAILADLAPKRWGSGKIDCPVCKTGRLHYRVTFSDVAQAHCTTKDCVDWRPQQW